MNRIRNGWGLSGPGSLLLIWLANVAIAAPPAVGPWPEWRGPSGDNHADENARLPPRWDLQTGENVVWKTKIPGRGHSTPIHTPHGIFLTTADQSRGTQSVLKLDAKDGRMVDEWTLHRGTLPRRIHRNNSHASPSMAFDGERLFASFYTDDSIVVTALSPDGREKWETRVCAFQPSSFEFGYGASPIVEDDLVIVAAEYDGQDSGIYALDRSTGRQVWKIPRPQNLNFASPIIATIAGQRQLMIAGADQFASYDPRTGKELWATNTTTEAICGTVVWDERYAMVSGGNPVSGTWCVSADGRERLIWEKPVMCYEQSLLAIKNYVFAVSDAGVMYCWRTHDGKRMWRERLLSGGISASPLLVDDHLVVASETGDVFVVKASPDRFSLRYQANAGDSIFASPVAIGDRLFLRVGVSEAQGRQEYVIAVGK